MRTKGVVIELESNEALVMTETGEFLICNPSPGIRVGTVMEVSLWDQKRFWKGMNIGISGVAVFFFGLLLGYGVFFNQLHQVYAYMDVELDPGATLALNREFRVVEVKPLNSDGRRLMKKEYLTGKPVREALVLLARSVMPDEKRFSRANTVLVTVAFSQTGPRVRKGEERELMRRLGEYLPERIPLAKQRDLNIKTLAVSAAEGHQAHQMAMSMGRYYCYRNARKMGIKVTLEGIRAISGVELLKGLRQMEAGIVPDWMQERRVEREEVEPRHQSTGNGASLMSNGVFTPKEIVDPDEEKRIPEADSARRKGAQTGTKAQTNIEAADDEAPPKFRLFRGGNFSEVGSKNGAGGPGNSSVSPEGSDAEAESGGNTASQSALSRGAENSGNGAGRGNGRGGDD